MSNVSEKLKLLQEAVDFFSQSLHVEQLMYYGYDRVHYSLQLEKSALFMLEDDYYDLKRQNGYDHEIFVETATPAHAEIARLVGRILTRDFKKYFSEKLLEAFNVNMVIPIIVKEDLVGFILSSGESQDEIDALDLEFATSVNQLMNKAYENAQSYKSLQEKNFELDKRVFNLYFINHCSRLLLSELKLDNLYNLCIDVVRELTASGVTAFFLKEAMSDYYVLKAYKNIQTFDQRFIAVPCVSERVPKGKVVLDIGADKDLIAELFGDISIFEEVSAQYIILIVKESLLGFVTISKAVNDKEHDKNLVDMIVSVANTIYIAMSNAMQFDQIQQQKTEIASQLSHLEHLQKAIQNINCARDLEELGAVALETLRVDFQLEAGFIAMANENQHQYQYQCIASVGYQEGLLSGEGAVQTLLALPPYEAIVEYTQSGYLNWAADVDNPIWENSNCLLLLPFTMDGTKSSGFNIAPEGLEEEAELLSGFLMITQTNSPLTQELLLVYKALVSAISPVMLHLNQT